MIRGEEAEGQPEAPQRISSGVSWWWLAPCVLALAAVPFVWRPLLRLTNSPPSTETLQPARSSQLGFSATHEGSDWKLVWSREALARLNVIGAMLTISDGGVWRLQYLSPQDLAAGTVFYIPRTSDLAFNLKVTVANGSDIEEQIRVLGAEKADEPIMAQRAPRRIGESSRDEAAEAAVTVEPGATPLVTAQREFRPPVQKAERSVPGTDTALPDVAMPATAIPQLPHTSAAPPPPAPKSAPPQPAPTQPAAPAQATPVAAPVVPSLGTVSRTEASPLRTVPAGWPRNTTRSGPVDIKIRVQIDPRGRVVGATPLQRTVANYPFVDSALTAARMWIFKPAVENGKPVAAESVLTFKFTP